MRNISFALTTPQILDGSKTVTRRLGWVHLKAGDQLRPVRNCMGLRKGEHLDVLRGPVRVVSVRREPLRAMLDDIEYGRYECVREGVLPQPNLFVSFFCATHRGCTPETQVTRIEFTYGEEDLRS